MSEQTITKPKYAYEGIFLPRNVIEEIKARIMADNPEITQEELDSWKPTADPHVTTSFTKGVPKIAYGDIGTAAKVVIDGYGYDAEKGLFALHVSEVSSDVEDIQKAVDMTQEKTPLHITIAVGHGSKPVQSKELFTDGKEYHKFEKPIEVRGSYGGFVQEGVIDILNDAEREFFNHAVDYLKDRDDEFANSFRAANAKDIGDKRLYLLQTMEQRIAGPTNFGSDFGKTTPEALFDKIADITQILVLQQQIKETHDKLFEGLKEFAKTMPEPEIGTNTTRRCMLKYQQTDLYNQLHAQLTLQKEEMKFLQEELHRKYPDVDFESIRETTERDRENGDTGPTCRTFEIPMPGNSGVIDIENLPDTAVIYLDQVHGDSISVLATGIEKEPSDVTHLIFGTNKDGDCSIFLTAFPGPMKPPFELSLDTEIQRQDEIDIGYARIFDTYSRQIQPYDVFTKEEAEDLGVTFVKYSPALPEKAKNNLKDMIMAMKGSLNYEKRWEYYSLEDILEKAERIRAFEAIANGDSADGHFDQPEGRD